MAQNTVEISTRNERTLARGAATTNVAKFISGFALMVVSTSSLANGISGSAVSNGKTNAPISSQNDSPTAESDFVELEKSAKAFNALANDSDRNGDRLFLVDAEAKFGAVAFTADGLVAYAQNPGRPHADKIIYTVSDGRGGLDKGVIVISVR